MLSPISSVQYAFSTISKLMPDSFQGARSLPICDNSSSISSFVALLLVSLASILGCGWLLEPKKAERSKLCVLFLPKGRRNLEVADP